MGEDLGRMLAGRYRLLAPIGQGGMGTVWRALDTDLDRTVAIKELRLPDDIGEEERRTVYARMEREARAAARLNHPGIVTVHDRISGDDDRPWIVMEYVQGGSLQDLLADEGRLPPARVAAVGTRMLEGLTAAHARGIVHRDIKPGNVLLAGHRVVLTDFGIAALDGDVTITRSGTVLGTPAFMSPEQVRGEPATAESDLWSLGATLYAAVEGRYPFDGPTHGAIFVAIATQDPAPPQHAGPLTDMITRLLSKDPAARPEAAEVLEQLSGIDTGDAPLTRAESPEATTADPPAAAHVRSPHPPAPTTPQAQSPQGPPPGAHAPPPGPHAPPPGPQSPQPGPQGPRPGAQSPQGPWQYPRPPVPHPRPTPIRLRIAYLPYAIIGAAVVVIVIIAVAAIVIMKPDAKSSDNTAAPRPNQPSTYSEPTVTFPGHKGDVEAVAFSPDGKTLATGGEDKTVRLWNAATGRKLATLKAHTGSVETAAFSPDGKTLATGGFDRTVRLWDVSAHREIATQRLNAPTAKLNGHDVAGPVAALTFSPDGKTLGIDVDYGRAYLWDVKSRKVTRTLKAPGKASSDTFTKVLFRPDGKALEAEGDDKGFRLKDAKTGDTITEFKGKTGSVDTLTFTPDRTRAAVSGQYDHTYRMWDASTGQITATYESRDNYLRAAQFSPDGKTLAVAADRLGDVNEIWLHDAASGHKTGQISLPEGDADCDFELTCHQAAFSPDGKSIAAGGDKDAWIWRLN